MYTGPSRHKSISICFVANSLDVLRELPDDARRRLGYQLHRLQSGERPTDWRPMPSIGRSVAETRVDTAAGAFRLIYLAGGDDTNHVLHCFAEKSGRTSRRDVELACRRYLAIVRNRA